MKRLDDLLQEERRTDGRDARKWDLQYFWGLGGVHPDRKKVIRLLGELGEK
jgi:hypothetical protein